MLNCFSRFEDFFSSPVLAASMAHNEGKHSLEAKFAAAVKVMRSLPEEGDNLLCLF